MTRWLLSAAWTVNCCTLVFAAGLWADSHGYARDLQLFFQGDFPEPEARVHSGQRAVYISTAIGSLRLFTDRIDCQYFAPQLRFTAITKWYRSLTLQSGPPTSELTLFGPLPQKDWHGFAAERQRFEERDGNSLSTHEQATVAAPFAALLTLAAVWPSIAVIRRFWQGRWNTNAIASALARFIAVARIAAKISASILLGLSVAAWIYSASHDVQGSIQWTTTWPLGERERFFEADLANQTLRLRSSTRVPLANGWAGGEWSGSVFNMRLEEFERGRMDLMPEVSSDDVEKTGPGFTIVKERQITSPISPTTAPSSFFAPPTHLDSEKEARVALAGVVLALAIWPVFATIRFALVRGRSFIRAKKSRCVVCGYDLRASPDRCPECGAINRTINPDRSPPPDSPAATPSARARNA